MAATSEPVGFSAISLPSGTDTVVSVPFVRPAVFTGQIVLAAGNIVSIAGNPNWAPTQFVYTGTTQPNTYHALIASGAMEGRSFIVTGNGPGTLALDLEGGDLSGLRTGDALRIVPCWTLGTLFPASDAGSSFTPTSVVTSPQTTVALPGAGVVGINNGPSATFFFYAGAWRQIGDVAANQDDQVVRPGWPLRIRNAANGGLLVSAGAVVMQKLALTLATRVGAPQDNPVALCRPVPVSLNGSGLVASGAFAPSPNALLRGDVLMVTDNAAPGINKPASAYYIYYNARWRKLGQPLTADFGGEPVFTPTQSVTIRTGPSLDGAKRYWVNPPPY